MCSPVRGSPSQSGIFFQRILIYLGFLLKSAIRYYAVTSQYLSQKDKTTSAVTSCEGEAVPFITQSTCRGGPVAFIIQQKKSICFIYE